MIEYRVLKAGRHFPEVLLEVREDNSMYADFDAEALFTEDDSPRYRDAMKGLRGVAGLVEATAREAELNGDRGVVIEKREVEDWELVERTREEAT